ncbi:carbonic anhydrase [Fusobacteria bacterium ZRK30]|uniref:carbonic anhydrase n=1 Tax=Psychrilyobacter atlanticus TaxID=271091 RepID=UPI0003FC15C0|nr:carbonic anhydrase [Psychrilyobacter atlanticus]UUV16898.1 carbonic anhydrase [Fusobacteria bacterium ZRK30]
MEKLLKGHQKFKEIKFKKNKDLYLKLVKDGQHPGTLFIGCSDSRVIPGLITGSKPGELFTIQNVGNFVAPYKPDEDYHSTASAIEYAVSVLKVDDIIVCGHSHCGAIKSLYKDLDKEVDLVHTNKWLELGNEAKKVAQLVGGSEEEKLINTEKLSAMFQLENLLTYPAVKRRVDEGSLHLHVWYYKIETGEIEYYDDIKGSFIPMDN